MGIAISSKKPSLKTIAGKKFDEFEKYALKSDTGKKILAADICMADTGIAGPAGSTLEKSVGLFYIGLAYKNEIYSQQHIFQGNRKQNKEAAAEALETIR